MERESSVHGPSVLLLVRNLHGWLSHGHILTQCLWEKRISGRVLYWFYLLGGQSFSGGTKRTELDRKLLARKTNRGKKRKCRDRKESAKSPWA